MFWGIPRKTEMYKGYYERWGGGSVKPPLSRGILDVTGGEPDGAEPGWGVQGVGGGLGYRPT